MEEGQIIDFSGLSKTFYTYDSSNSISLDRKENGGIEEAFNCVESSQIVEMMTGREQEIQGYTEAGEIAKVFLENDEFAQAIRNSQFHGDDSWIQFLGEEISEIIIENLTILVYSVYASFKILNTPEKIKQFEQIKQNAKDALNEILKKAFPRKFLFSLIIKK